MTKLLFAFAVSVFVGLNAFGQEDIKSEVLKEHVYFLASDELEGRGFGTSSGKKAANYIADYFKEAGLKPVGDSYFHPFMARIGQTMIEGRNVVGIIEGSDPILKNEYIVYGAHYDHISYKLVDGEKVIYNGADDNASGTAAIMEMGKALASHKKSMKRSIIFVAFDAEESGLIGSREFVNEETVPIDQIKLMMSIDMIGRYAESESLIMGAMDHIKGGTDHLLAIAEKHKVKVSKTGGEVFNRTDTKPFGDAGVPAVYVSSGIIGPYHKPEDDAETIDYDGMEKITNMLVELTVTLANEEQLIPSNQIIAHAKNKGLPFFRFGVKTNIGGSSHTYPNEYYKGKSSFSSELGLMTQFKISKNFSLQPEVLYSTMGSKAETGKFRTHSITTPVSLVFASNMQSTVSQRFYLSIGGYYSYHFAGRLAKQSIDFSNDYVQSETGLTYSLGFEIMSVFVSVNYKHGLNNILLEENMGEIKTRGMYFSLGYMF